MNEPTSKEELQALFVQGKISRRHFLRSALLLGQGEMQVVTVLFNAKKYFRPGSVVQPFLGAGLGLASVNMSGQLEGNTAGIAAQALGGLAFRWEHVGLYTELKYQLATTSDVDVSGAAFMVGLGLHF